MKFFNLGMYSLTTKGTHLSLSMEIQRAVFLTILLLQQKKFYCKGKTIEKISNNKYNEMNTLGECQGDCDSDNDCMIGLVCLQRNSYESVPGCDGGTEDSSRTDYCVKDNSDNEYENFINSSPQQNPVPKNEIPVAFPYYSPPTNNVDEYNSPVQSQQDSNALISYGFNPPLEIFPLGHCEGDCDNDSDCADGLVCYQRESNQAVPSCDGMDDTRVDYCIYDVHTPPFSQPPFPSPLVPSPDITSPVQPQPPVPSPSVPSPDIASPVQTQPPVSSPSVPSPDITSPVQIVPSPSGDHFPPQPPTSPQGSLISYGRNPPSGKFPLGHCEGDCDNDSDCGDGLICFQRDNNEAVPNCVGTDNSRTDYCIYDDEGPISTNTGTNNNFTPGKLKVQKLGLLLSEGLDVKLIATSGEDVIYSNGEKSNDVFHYMPDGAACFEDVRDDNINGWIYVSNSEVRERDGGGGVGSITFNSNGDVIKYERLLTGTSRNCGGGRTPWNTWASAEEKGSGKVYQVDPTGQKDPEEMTIGKNGGSWESFAYDVRDYNEPHFYVTEDSETGAMERFTPDNPDWDNNPWNILHGSGKTEYLILHTTTTTTTTSDNGGTNHGTYEWSSNREYARNNARIYYPYSEGIDVYKDYLYFVCKKVQMIYTLNLKDNTWRKDSTKSGLFDGQPDAITRLVDDTFNVNMLYFTEEGGNDSGIHARDKDARYYTIMESIENYGETTGLSLSPNGRYMYVAYQDVGKVFCLFRIDGKPFQAAHLDIKYHKATK